MFLFEVLQPLSAELFWILCLAFFIAFLLAFSVGANDVSNSFGTSVGSRVLTVTQACILATIFEMAGATLLGYSVCDTFRKKMYDVQLYDGAQKELMLGALACLIGSSIWNLVATALKMPISGTHSIVGATIGFSVVLRGWDSIRWLDMARIVASWFASPLLSGLISSLIYTLISKTIIRKIDPLRHGLKALPLFYGATIFINVASIVIDGPRVLGLDRLPWYAGLCIALLAASVTICCVAMILVPRLKRQILDELVARRTVPKCKGLAPIKSSLKPPTPPSPAPLDEERARAAYDNVTFKSDHDAIESMDKKQQQQQQPPPPAKVNREFAVLDPSQLEQAQTDTSQTKSGSTSDALKRPQVAPKPAHLRRQLAKDSSEAMHEIDLTGSGTNNTTTTTTTKRDLEIGAALSLAPPKPLKSGNGHTRYHQNGYQKAKILTDTGERYEVAKLFSSLQILTACFASFAHGTNDVSNAVAPLIPIWNIYTTGQEDVSQQTQVWILAFGSIGICTGLWAWGRAVMSTISDGLTKITPSKGFAIELGAAISVLCATKLGLPISTTHCKVGSLVIVGFVSSKFLAQDNLLGQMSAPMQFIDESEATKNGAKQELQIEEANATDSSVDWRMFANIAITWVSTVPLAALASAAVMYLLKWLVL